jgi:4'-phosphopantetheinyl transferase
MTDVYWLEQTEADVLVENDWLSPGEAIRLNHLRVAKRRADWRLGRWTAKRALAICLNVSDRPRALAEIEIRPAPSGAPEVFLANQPSGASISLSHCSGRAVCAVAPSPVALGCDLERIEWRSDAFLADYFTAEEQALVARAPAADRSLVLALLWSGKESTLKALHTGLRLDTRSVVVNADEALSQCDGWHPLQVRSEDHRVFQGWWQHSDGFLRTLVSAPPPRPPIPVGAILCL